MAGVMGGKSKRNARALLDANMITQEEYDKIMKAKDKGERKKDKSLIDLVKEAVSGD